MSRSCGRCTCKNNKKRAVLRRLVQDGFLREKVPALGHLLVEDMEMLVIQDDLHGESVGFGLVFQGADLQPLGIGGKGKKEPGEAVN